MLRKLFPGILLSGTALSLLAAGSAQAAGTAAGTSVSNTASVGYTVGGTAQTPVSSNTVGFLVDRKVNLTVAEVGGTPTLTTFGATAQVTTFTVTNNTNSVQDFRLFATEQVALSPTAFSHVDNYAVANVRVYVDSNGNGVYDAGVDTATYIDELAADATVTVFIVADIPSTGPTNPIAGVALTAVAATGGTGGSLGADLVASVLADSPTTVDNVFADGAGPGDLARDGRSSALDEYDVGGATITAVKTATTISDPLDGIVLPKAIPGAIVEYCIQVQNAGPGTATNVSLTDTIPANSTYVPGSLYVGGSVLLGACVADGSNEDDDAVGPDETDGAGGSFDGAKVYSSIATLAPLTTKTTRFRVTIN